MATVKKVSRNPKKGDQLQSTLNQQTLLVDLFALDNYLVQFTDSSATPLDALVASDGTTSIPTVGAVYGSDGLAGQIYCTRVFPQRSVKSPSLFEVQVEWRNIVPPSNQSGVKWNINVRVRSVPFEQDAFKDVNGNAVKNSAGDFFSPTLKRTFYDEEIAIEFDSQTIDISSIDACRGHYNNESVTMSINGVSRIFDAKTLLFVCPEYSTIQAAKPPYDWRQSYVFRFRSDGWIQHVADQGYHTLSGSDRLVNKDKFGDHLNQQVLLDGSGGVNPVGDDAVYMDFDFYGGADFTSLLTGIR